MKVFRRRKGFSLIELVVALSILTIGLLGVIPLAIATIRLNSLQNQMLNAKYLAERYSERFKSVSFDAPDLANDGDNNDLDDRNNPDHTELQTIENIQYTIMWNIADNLDGTKTIRTFVRWFDTRSGRQREYIVETVRSPYEL
uniref:Prepilin-type N-terminal cleavage/methylation domain-containing protein n=1 Tax=candidate division WOR-3 bacterium TaxID=2052148 RepID=A0A7V3ZWY1_UNCW3